MNYDATHFALGKKKKKTFAAFKKDEATYYTSGTVVKLFFWLSLIYLTLYLGNAEKSRQRVTYAIFSLRQ